MKHLLLFVFLIFSSERTFAQTKGLFFSIGETFLKLSGHSYSELSEKIYSDEVQATKCLHELMKIEFILGPRSLDLQNCAQSPKQKFEMVSDTGFKLIDFLRAGCKGKIELDAWRDTTDFLAPPSVRINTTFVTIDDHGGVVFLDLKKTKGDDLDPWKQYEARIQDIQIVSEQLSTLELNKFYDSIKVDLNGKEVKSDVMYKFKIYEGPNKKINISYDFNVSNERAAKYRSKQKISFQCESKSLEEMNIMVGI